MKKILLILIVIIFSFAGLKAEDFDYGHCFCAHRHIITFSASSQLNLGKNWSNGLVLVHSPSGLFFSSIELKIQSTRLGSSLFTNDQNQDIITFGLSNSSIFRKINRSLFCTINVGYVKTDGDNSKNFLNSNLILAPEISFGNEFTNTNISLGYNVFNSLYMNKNVAPFYLKIAISIKDVYYCKNSNSYLNEY